MWQLLTNLLPALVLFGAGIWLRRRGYAGTRQADGILKLIVNVALPAVILGTVARLDLSPEMAYLPAVAALVILSLWPLAFLAARAFRLDRGSRGTFMVGVLIMNVAFIYPFILAAWGRDGVALLALFDFGNAAVVLTLVYGIAAWHGGSPQSIATKARHMVLFPPVPALAVAILLNTADVPLPPWIFDGLAGVGGTLMLLVMLALGIYFRLHPVAPGPVAGALLLRGGAGLALGWLWVSALDLQGLVRQVALVAAAAPVGFNTVVFASVQHLNREFAASLASLSVACGLFYVPVVIAVVQVI